MRNEIPPFLTPEKNVQMHILHLSFQFCHWHDIQSLLLSHWWCKTAVGQQPKSCVKPKTRNHRDFTGVSTKGEQKQKLWSPVRRSSHKKKAAALCKPSPSREGRDSQEVTWGFSTKQAYHQRVTDPEEQRPSQEWMLHSPIRESWHM